MARLSLAPRPRRTRPIHIHPTDTPPSPRSPVSGRRSKADLDDDLDSYFGGKAAPKEMQEKKKATDKGSLVRPPRAHGVHVNRDPCASVARSVPSRPYSLCFHSDLASDLSSDCATLDYRMMTSTPTFQRSRPSRKSVTVSREAAPTRSLTTAGAVLGASLFASVEISSDARVLSWRSSPMRAVHATVLLAL